MPRPTKLTHEVQQKIGDGVSLGLTYALAANSAGVTYQTFNEWMKLGRDSTSGKYFEFYKHIEQRNAEGAPKILQRLNDAANAGNCQVCMFILERRFPEDFGRRVYKKTNVVSENINANVEITVQEADILRKQILAKLDRFCEL
jgi:transposase